MTSTYIPIATTTLTTSAASVTFGSIPQDYRDLVLVQNTKQSTAGSYTEIQINSDTGANYSGVNMAGNGSTTHSGSSTTAYSYPNRAFLESTTEAMLAVLQFMDYSATDKHKTMLFRANIASGNVNAVASRYASTSAITTIQLFAETGSFTTGSTFSLYGIEA